MKCPCGEVDLDIKVDDKTFGFIIEYLARCRTCGKSTRVYAYLSKTLTRAGQRAAAYDLLEERLHNPVDLMTSCAPVEL